jgi:radical SAM protein with 4Fe4S-binding SPASM domain
MDLDLAKKVVDQARDCGVELFYLGGGDPFTKRWVFELVEYILQSQEVTLVLSTKEWLSLEACKHLAGAGVRNLQVSIDSLDSATADLLAGRSGYVNEAMETIDNLQSAGINATTHSVVTKYNYRHIPELVRHLLSKGITDLIVTRYYRSTYRHSDALFVDDAEVDWLNTQLEDIERPTETTLMNPEGSAAAVSDERALDKFMNRSTCAFGRIGLVVTPSARVIPCEQLPTESPYILGDLHTDTLREVWQSQRLLSLLYPTRSDFQGTPCFDCDLFADCIYGKGWCLRDVYKATGTTYGVHPHCPYSNDDARLM